MQTLHQEFQKSDCVVISAVAGMSGVGKTELAIKYAREHEQDYPGGICLLTARDKNLAANILLFAQLYLKLEVPQEFRGKPLTRKEQVNWCWQNWQPPEASVLLVLDDVTSWKSCRDFLPKINRFRILITTRLRNLDSNFVELPLKVFSLDEALELLTNLVGERRVQRELQTATDLCKWLGYLPLGLELVGRYLKEDPDLSLVEMWERLKEKRLEDEAINPSDEQLQDTEMTAERGVKAAFELSWQELNPISQGTGQLLSLFKPTVIPWELVTFSSETQALGWTTEEIKSAKKELYKLSLIDRIDNNKYKIHPLVREFFKAKLAFSEQANDKETFSAAIEAFYNKLGNEILEQKLNDIENQIAEYFEQLEFEEKCNPEDCLTLDLEDITVTIDSVRTNQKKLLYVGDDFFKFELSVEIVFIPEGSYPDEELSYYDSEEGEVVFLNHITEVQEESTATITVKVKILFDENDPDINKVECVVKEPIKFDRQPTEFNSPWNYNNGED
ncbi:NB-ARC domain-containing protein [Argonema galeatum]|uniref:NB-ARC domain-containing protein n=1 Tax=Argonema galeatum TaxID=2942762 RepID=UPI0023E01748|nr:NB-ARC domain-containing protein [Argonema galeatum]MCL1468347.1 hypothetical protein [Argonema galeatum A003/A1]